MNKKIIIAEDDESIRRLLEVTLTSHGYTPQSFDNAEEALTAIEAAPPALAIFDIMLTGQDGISALRKLREEGRAKELPVILLTARGTELDKIIGLDAGADDYIVKPFSVLELLARVRTQLRRVSVKDEKNPFQSGALHLNPATREVFLADTALALTFKEFDLLALLMEQQHRAVSREELLTRVWGEAYCGETRTLDIHIATLRQKLRKIQPNAHYIKTVRGLGYRFVGEG